MNPRKTLEVTIELTSPNTFDVQFLDSESGDYCCISCTDTRIKEHDVRLAAEIRSWVSIMREEQEFRETEAFARQEHKKAMSEESDPAHKVIFKVIDCDDKPAVYMYTDLASFQKEWAKDDACVPMLDDHLLHAEVDGIVYHGETFLDAMNAIGYAHGWRF